MLEVCSIYIGCAVLWKHHHRHLNSYSHTAWSSILYPLHSLPNYPTIPATTGHSSQCCKWCWSNNRIPVNVTTRVVATAWIGYAPEPINYAPSQICTWKGQSICLHHCECLSYLQCEYTLMTNLSPKLGGMDILLDRTSALLHSIFIVFACLFLRGLQLAFVGIQGFSYSIMSWCPFNMLLASTETIVCCRLDYRVLARPYA